MIQRVDIAREDGVVAFATWPIFHQIVSIAFPKGFAPVFEDNHPPAYLQESVLVGETVENWTQMVSVTGAEGAATKSSLTPEIVRARFVHSFQQKCPTAFTTVQMSSESISKFNGTVTVVGCGTLGQPGQEHSETMLLIVLKGDQDYYTVQWSERGQASQVPASIDQDLWSSRFRQLMPIRVCARIPGEQPPYPSCVDATK